MKSIGLSLNAATARLLAALVGSCVCLLGMPAYGLETVSLQLKYLHQFQFAGYYAAVEKGFYRDVGLDVKTIEGLAGSEPLEHVLSGTGHYGVGSSGLIVERYAGKPVVVLGVIFQHSPYVLLARQTGPTQGIHDLKGKRVMIAAQSEELSAYLKKEGIASSDITRVEHSFNPEDLIRGNVDAISAYATNEPDYLNNKGFAYQAYTPRSAGIDFYGDNFFTSEEEVQKNPKRVKDFRQATMRGWQYALSHQEEMVDLILAKYSKRSSRQHLLFEARQIAELVKPDLVEIGYMNPGRWQHIAEVYADLGMLPKGPVPGGFLYDPDPRRDLTWLYSGLAVMSVLAIALWLRDMTRLRRERLLAQSQILASEERLTLAMEGAGYGMWDWDIEAGRVTYSDQWLAMHGFARGEVSERVEEWKTRVHPDDVRRVEFLMQDHLEGKSPVYLSEHRALCKDGSWKWVVDRGRAVSRDAKGKPLRVVCVHVDISERKEASEALRASEEKYRALIETTGTGYLILDTQGMVVDANPEYARLAGHRFVTDILGKSVLQWTAPDAREKNALAVAQCVREGSIRDLVMDYVDANHHVTPVEINATVIETRDGLRIVSLCRDITRRMAIQAQLVATRDQAVLLVQQKTAAESALREANDTLETRVVQRTAELVLAHEKLAFALDALGKQEADARLATLVASVSHELNSPLGNSLITASTLVEQSSAFQSTVRANQLRRSDVVGFAASVQAGSELMLRNLRRAGDMLQSFRQVVNDQASEQRRIFELSALATDTLATLSPSLKPYPHRVNLAIEPGIMMDSMPGALVQVFVNLINNAYLHAFDGHSNGLLVISARIEGEYVHLRFQDNGVGIPTESLDRLFELFFSTKKGRGGTGLGMAIVKNLVNAILGGSIAVFSEVGMGTRFDITIPRVSPNTPSDPIDGV